jgi:hypothetical protein
MTVKRIALRVILEIDVDAWVDEYGCEKAEVPTNVRSYIKSALYSMPVQSKTVEIK